MFRTVRSHAFNFIPPEMTDHEIAHPPRHNKERKWAEFGRKLEAGQGHVSCCGVGLNE